MKIFDGIIIYNEKSPVRYGKLGSSDFRKKKKELEFISNGWTKDFKNSRSTKYQSDDSTSSIPKNSIFKTGHPFFK